MINNVEIILFVIYVEKMKYFYVNQKEEMGIIKDLKNIFFGASSVAKHSAEKAGDFLKEEGGDLMDKTKDIVSGAGETILDKTSGLKDTVIDKSSGWVESSKSTIEDIGESINESPLVTKMKDFTEDVGGKVINKSDELLDKSMTVSEQVGEKVLDVKDQLMDKAKDVSEKVGEKLESTMDKADKWAAEEKLKPKKEFADDTLDASGSLLEDTDDFFSRADKYAEGEYDSFSEGKIDIQEGKVDKPKFSEGKPALGFEDLDGDGNEIIDDAIIDPE